jgi:WD40 repeat protein
MEYVKGLPITEYSDKHKLTIEDRLGLFLQVCHAAHHAHQKGIIHRDIKPSNILVSAVDDQAMPKIIDFGIAKAMSRPLTDSTIFTEQGQMVGTPEYMSPEQAEMADGDVDTRSDIYSLGVVLYQLLTGALPFSSETLRGGGIEHVRKVICEQDPKTPSTRLTALGEEAKAVAQKRQTDVTSLARRLARELEWIPLKAVRKDRTRRYRSAAEFADDIENYLQGAPLIAGPESVTYRASKFVKRHRVPAIAIGAVAVVLVAATIVSTVLYARAVVANESRRRVLYVNQVALAQSAYREADIDRARKLLEDCPADLREFAWSYLWRLVHIVPETPTIEHSNPVNAVAFSPTAGTIATASGRVITLRHATTHKIQAALEGHRDSVQSLAFSPDGRMLISAGIDGRAIIWDATARRRIHLLASPIGLSRLTVAVAFSSDSRTAAVSFDIGRAGAVLVWDGVTGESVSLARDGTDTRVFSLAFSSDGRTLAVGERGETTLWDTTSHKQVATFAGGGHIDAVAFLDEDRTLVTAGSDGMLRLWDVATKKATSEINASVAPIYSVALSPNGETLATASADSTIRLWGTTTWQETGWLKGHTSEVYGLDFSADGTVLASASKDRTVKLWEPSARPDSDTLIGHNGLVDGLVFTPDSKRVITAAFGSPAVKMWDVATGRDLSDALGDVSTISWAGGLGLAPDGRTLAIGTDGLMLWDMIGRRETGRLELTNNLDGGTANCATFSPDGKTLAAHTYAGTFKLWDTSTFRELIVLEGYGSHFAAAAFSPDGRTLAIPEHSGLSTTLWETSTLRDGRGDAPAGTLTGHTEQINAVAFSPDGSTLASASDDTTIKLWDSATRREEATLTGHTSSVYDLAFSPDGRTLASGGKDGTVRLWNLLLNEQVAVLEGHSASVWKIAFSPDGKTLASTSLDGTIRLWRAATEHEVKSPSASSE